MSNKKLSNQPESYLDRIWTYLQKRYKKNKAIPSQIKIANHFNINDRTIGRNYKRLEERGLVKVREGKITHIKVKGIFKHVKKSKPITTVKKPIDLKKLYEYLYFKDKEGPLPTRFQMSKTFVTNEKTLYKALRVLKKRGWLKIDKEGTITLIKQLLEINNNSNATTLLSLDESKVKSSEESQYKISEEAETNSQEYNQFDMYDANRNFLNNKVNRMYIYISVWPFAIVSLYTKDNIDIEMLTGDTEFYSENMNEKHKNMLISSLQDLLGDKEFAWQEPDDGSRGVCLTYNEIVKIGKYIVAQREVEDTIYLIEFLRRNSEGRYWYDFENMNCEPMQSYHISKLASAVALMLSDSSDPVLSSNLNEDINESYEVHQQPANQLIFSDYKMPSLLKSTRQHQEDVNDAHQIKRIPFR